MKKNKLNYLFIYPDFLEDSKHIKNIPGNYNEGLASLSAMLKLSGHNVMLYHETYMPEKDEFIAKVKEFNPDMIGFTIRTTALEFASEMIGWLNEELPDIYVTAGGYHPTLAPLEVLEIPGMDAVCIGEGETVTKDFVDYFAKHGKPNMKAESFWLKDAKGKIIQNKIRPYLINLDELPFPDLDLFDFNNLKSNLQNTAEVIVSRGCLYSCTYCANAQLRNVYPQMKDYARFRSPENAIQLLEHILKKDPKIEYFNFNDAIFNMYEDWFYDFIELYQKRIKRKYTCNLRFNHMDEKMAHTLAESGCYLVVIGLENGNEEYRAKYLHRVMNNEHIVKISHLLKKEGIIVYTYNILGLPHETLALSLETVKLNARMHTNNVVASLFFPYPATELKRISEEGGFIDPTVSRYDPVQLRMPNYPRSDILYMKHSFLTLMAKYRKLYRNYEGEELEAKINALDKKILSKHHPRKLISFYRGKKHNFIVFLKRNGQIYFKGLYKQLRLLKLKLQNKKNA